MPGTSERTVVSGLARDLESGGEAVQARFELGPADFSLLLEGLQPTTAAYRDVSTITADQGRVLLVLGDGTVRLVVEQLGTGLGTLVGEIRERRARQMLGDRLIDLPADERFELVEYAAGDEHGVAQICFHPWGLALLPLDERRSWRLIRRADIAAVEADRSAGRVAFAEQLRPGGEPLPPIVLLGLGEDAERIRARVAGLRDAAATDGASIVATLIPDAPFAVRERASGLLVDGRPVSPAELGDGAPLVEGAVLGDPTYAATYRTLIARGGGDRGDAPRWLALAPRQPADPSEHMAWFLVGLPNDLLAFELVSEGSHATYLFRAGGSPESAAAEISDCLIDARFLREPIYLTDTELSAPENLRYRLAIAALPSLRAARARFVRRLIHTDEASWSAALDQAITTGGT